MIPSSIYEQYWNIIIRMDNIVFKVIVLGHQGNYEPMKGSAKQPCSPSTLRASSPISTTSPSGLSSPPKPSWSIKNSRSNYRSGTPYPPPYPGRTGSLQGHHAVILQRHLRYLLYLLHRFRRQLQQPLGMDPGSPIKCPRIGRLLPGWSQIGSLVLSESHLLAGPGVPKKNRRSLLHRDQC